MNNKKYSKYLIFIFAFGIIITLIVYITMSKSYNYYGKAKEAFEEQNYKEALIYVNKALEKDNLNRPALLLKTKINKILNSNEKYKKAKEFHKTAMRHLFEENYSEARYFISKSYGLILSIPTDAHNIEKVNELRKQVEKDLDKIMAIIPSKFYDTAVKLAEKGQYITAFEYLNNLQNQNRETIELKNQLAFKIGTERYSKIIASKKAKDHVVRDAIYWLSQVSEESTLYDQAQKQIQILKNYLKE